MFISYITFQLHTIVREMRLKPCFREPSGLFLNQILKSFEPLLIKNDNRFGSFPAKKLIIKVFKKSFSCNYSGSVDDKLCLLWFWWKSIYSSSLVSSAVHTATHFVQYCTHYWARKNTKRTFWQKPQLRFCTFTIFSQYYSKCEKVAIGNAI